MSVASSRSMSRYPEHWVTFALVFVSSTLLLSITSIIHAPANGFSITVEAGLPDADSSPGEFARAARLFERADPVADAYSAIQSGKTRLWAGTGSPADWFIQGVPEERFGSYQRRYGLRFLYSGDVLHSDEEMHYRTVVDAYAERYNQTILAHLVR